MDPRFPAAGGLSRCPKSQNLQHFAIREKFFQQFSRDFPGVFLENPRTDPGNSHSLLEFSEKKGKINILVKFETLSQLCFGLFRLLPERTPVAGREDRILGSLFLSFCCEGSWGLCFVFSAENKGGWKTQGRGKHTIKPLPQNRFWTPPTYDTFSPPPRLFSPCCFA